MKHRLLRLSHVLIMLCILVLNGILSPSAIAQNLVDYALAPGDAIRLQVFQNPELTLETRVSENGSITYPLIGTVRIGSLSIAQAEKKIASALQDGGFLQNPQVSVVLVQMRGSQISVLGQVVRAGRFPLETANTRVSDMLALAGGPLPGGDDVAIVSGLRNGQPFYKRVDIPAIFLDSQSQEDIVLQGGDTVYVHRAPTFYIYGEAQRPGAYRIERGMTVMQALSLGGGPTARGSERRLRMQRQMNDGSTKQLEPALGDLVRSNDVIYVKESIF